MYIYTYTYLCVYMYISIFLNRRLVSTNKLPILLTQTLLERRIQQLQWNLSKGQFRSFWFFRGCQFNSIGSFPKMVMDGWKSIHFEVHSEVRCSFQKKGHDALAQTESVWRIDSSCCQRWNMKTMFEVRVFFSSVWVKAEGERFFLFTSQGGGHRLFDICLKNKKTGRTLKNMWCIFAPKIISEKQNNYIHGCFRK